MTRNVRRASGVVTAVFAVLVLGAAPALADPVPLLECVAANPDGSYTAVIGVDNDGPAVTIPIGNNTNGKLDNRFNGTWDRGQPTSFAAGRTVGAFTLDVADGGSEMWHLGNSRLRIDRDGTPCSNIAAAPDVPTVVLAGVAAAVGAAWAFRRVDASSSGTGGTVTA